MCLCFDDLTDASRPHSILGGERELVPGATLEVLKAIGALAGTDGEVPPLLAVILRVLQDVAFTRGREDVKEGGRTEGRKTKRKERSRKRNDGRRA